MPSILLLLAGLVLCAKVHAQAVTAPFSVSQRLVNPAAATTRAHRALSAAIERSEEKLTVLNLVSSSYSETININQLVGHASWVMGSNWKTEFDFAYQGGVKTNKNGYSDSSNQQNSTTKDDVNLAPVQLIVAKKLTPSFSLGIKTLATLARVTTTNSYKTSSQDSQFVVDQTNKLDAQFLVFGTGFSYNLWRGLFVGYAADFNQFKSTKTMKGTFSSTSTSNARRSNSTDVDSSITRNVRRDIMGVSYFVGDPRKNAFRTELSSERITPLTKGSNLKDGRLMRMTIEGQWLYFHLGGEYIVREGFMVDTFNLIPYFFKFDDFSNQAKTDYGFFGGLRSAKGHSFGAFFTTSSNEGQERLSGGDPTLYQVRRTNQAFGISYSYVF